MIRDLVAIFGVIAGFTYYVLTVRVNQKNQRISLRNQELARKSQEQALETRQTQILMNLYETYRAPDFANAWGRVLDQEYTDFDDYWAKYGGNTNREAWSQWQSVARFFHGIGILVKRKMVDIELVEELLGTMIAVSWYRMGPIVIGFRKSRAYLVGDEDWWSESYQSLYGFEYLYHELEKRSKLNR